MRGVVQAKLRPESSNPRFKIDTAGLAFGIPAIGNEAGSHSRNIGA